MKAVRSPWPAARLRAMKSCAALYSRGKCSCGGLVEWSTVLSCMAFLAGAAILSGFSGHAHGRFASGAICTILQYMNLERNILHKPDDADEAPFFAALGARVRELRARRGMTRKL